MSYVEKFKKGKWFDKSNSMLADKSKVLSVLSILARYMKKGGLKKVREQLRLLMNILPTSFTDDIKTIVDHRLP